MIRIVALVIKYVNLLKSTKINTTRRKSKVLETATDIEIQPILEKDIDLAQDYYFKKASLEVRHFVKKAQYTKFSKEKNGKLLHNRRILPTNSISITGSMANTMQDLSAATFCIPIVDKHSPLAYAIINDIHWDNKVAQHSGAETVWRYVLKKTYIVEVHSVVKSIKRLCQMCRYVEEKTIGIIMGPVSEYSLKIASAFYITQVDLTGPFKAYSKHNKRATLKIWLVVFCCATTTTINIKVMEDYSTTAFIQTFTRFSCEVAYPKKLLPDEGSQLIKGCTSMKPDIRDIKSRLSQNVKIDFETCPVGGNSMHEKVKHKIQEVKKLIEKSILNELLSVIQWETCAAEIANRINDLPLALSNIVSNFETMDLIAPNRLMLGRNNDRSPSGCVKIASDSKKILETNQNIFNTWFENWLLSHVPNIMHQPKWFRTEYDLKEGDVDLFLKQDSLLTKTYQYGIVVSVQQSSDGVISKVKVKYRNANENVDRETFRSVRQLVMVHPVDEIDIIQEINNIKN